MARPRGEILVTCQNSRCRYCNRERGKDVIRWGSNSAGHQLYRCLHCGHTFVETIMTPLYHKHMPESEIIRICKLLVEKNGIRSIERITGHHRDTIGNLLEDLAEHAEYVNETLLRSIPLEQYEMDELWTVIKKNRKRLSVTADMNLRKVMRGSTPP